MEEGVESLFSPNLKNARSGNIRIESVSRSVTWDSLQPTD